MARKDNRERIYLESNIVFKNSLHELAESWGINIHEAAQKAVYEALEREKRGDISLVSMGKDISQMKVSLQNIDELLHSA